MTSRSSKQKNYFYVLNKDISRNTLGKRMKFEPYVKNIHTQGTRSQNFDLGLSFYLM